ncbi:hypothetical protein EMIT0347P_10916 [Pseudomonas sp. IT-347P]
MPAPNLTETFSKSGLAPNCIVMLAVEIKGFSCEAFLKSEGAAGARGPSQSALKRESPVINQGGRVKFGGDCTGLAL